MALYSIDPKSAVPVYSQLFRQIERHIASGEIANGEKLPSIRELASVLRINPNTVAKTYRLLEADGLVISRKGRGVFVDVAPSRMRSNRRELFGEMTEEYVKMALSLGMEAQEIQEGIEDRLMRENDDD
jgi:GntR family transcriptional regulator